MFALASAGLLYGVTSLAGGSGFSAVFVAGLLLGDARLPYAGEIDRFTVSLASLAEVAVFLALGLTIDVGGIAGQDWLGGLLIFIVMAVLVRPLVVVLTLARSALSRPEKAFIAWSGLKGAVPVLLAAFAVLGGVPDSGGSTTSCSSWSWHRWSSRAGSSRPWRRACASRCNCSPALPWELSVKLAEPPRDRVELAVEQGSPADGSRLEDLPLGDRGWVTLVVRDAHAVPARPEVTLRAGDVIFLLGIDNEPLLAEAFTGAR